jgi:hypothetical protein
MIACDNFMNITLRDVILTAPDGDKFYQMKEVYLKGNVVSSRGLFDWMLSENGGRDWERRCAGGWLRAQKLWERSLQRTMEVVSTTRLSLAVVASVNSPTATERVSRTMSPRLRIETIDHCGKKRFWRMMRMRSNHCRGMRLALQIIRMYPCFRQSSNESLFREVKVRNVS